MLDTGVVPQPLLTAAVAFGLSLAAQPGIALTGISPGAPDDHPDARPASTPQPFCTEPSSSLRGLHYPRVGLGRG